MKICFYCATPYHIVSSLIIALNNKKSCTFDLYLLNHFNTNDLVSRIKSLNIFDNVIVINQSNKSLVSRLKRVVNVFFIPKEIKSIYNNFDYDKVYFFAYDFNNISIIVKKSKKQKKQCKFIYGDDGIGSYMDIIYEPKFSLTVVLKILNRYKYLSEIKNIALFAPDLNITNTRFETEKIEIKRSTLDDITNRCLPTVWPCNILQNKIKIVYFKSIVSEILEDDYCKGEKLLLKAISDSINPNYVAVKPHPRDANNNLNEMGLVSLDKIPFETYYSIFDFNKLILISPISTSMFTPKIIFDKEPIIIITNRLFTMNEKMSKDFFEYLEKYKKKYKSHKNIFVPRNMEEFKEILKKCEEIIID